MENKKTQIKPIIGRIGGKWRLSKWIIEHIKRFEWSLYVEPFCGSAAIYFQLLNDGIPELIKSRGHHPRFVWKNLYSHDVWRVCYPNYSLPETVTITVKSN